MSDLNKPDRRTGPRVALAVAATAMAGLGGGAGSFRREGHGRSPEERDRALAEKMMGAEQAIARAKAKQERRRLRNLAQIQAASPPPEISQ